MNHKLLVIAPSLGVVSRGAETFTYEIIQRLAKSWDITVISGAPIDWGIGGIETVLCPDFSPGYLQPIIKKFYSKLVSLRNAVVVGPFFKFTLKIIDRIYYLHPDVLLQWKFSLYLGRIKFRPAKSGIIFPQNGLMGVKYATKVRNLNPIKIAYTGHGGIGIGEKLILKESPDAYIAISSAASKWASTFCPNVSYIPNGVDITRFQLALKKQESKFIHILSVGALTEYKRHSLTIKAAAAIPNAFLTIIGSGELLGELSEEGNRLLSGRFEILNASYDEMSKIYRNADVFVLPSLNEPMGIVYLEALASGLPVVAPNDSVRREVLGDFGSYVDVTNIDGYAQAILLAHQCNSAEKSLARRSYVESHYSWDAIADRYHQLFLSLLKK